MLKKSSQLLRAAPDIPTLHQLLAKCFQQPGDKLQVQWRSTENQLFILDVVYSLKDRRPNWQLICEKSGRRTIIADYAGHDILLVYKQISTAANNALDARAGDESSRVNKTRDARAAATDWLESKAESGSEDATKAVAANQEAKQGSSPDFWSENPTHYPSDERQGGGSIAAAVDESPWSTSSSAAQSPSPGQSYSSAVQSPSLGQSNSPAAQSPSLGQSSSSAAQAPLWGQSNSSATDKSYSWAPAQSGSSTPPQSSASAPAQSKASAPAQPKPSTAPMPPPGGMPAPAPVKVTGPGPQSSAPRPLPSQTIPPRGQAPPTTAAKDRSTVHPDKGASATDKTPSSADKSAPVKKHISPEKITAAPKQPSAAPDLGRSALPTSGDLTNLTVPKLLKQLKAAQVTGRLEFVDDPLTAIVYLEDGKPIEAWLGELKGDSALLEILLWTSGKYSLNIGITATNRNVKTSPEVLVEHNKNIASLLEELAAEGLTATSTFAPANPLLSSEEFDRLATPDAPMELEKLARLYIKLDGKKTIGDLNELQVLPRPALVQAIHHLYYNSIIDIVDPTEKHKELVVTPKVIDNAAIQAVMTSLRRVDTGLFIYPAFLYFLQEEFFRIYRAKSSMSVLIFEMRELSAADGLVRRVPLSSDSIADATMRISGCKRHTDIVAHYEANDFAILLPSTGSGGTKVFANKVIKALTDSPLAGTEGKKLSFSFGSASMPEDFKELSMLLGAAETAMTFARQRGKTLVLFKEMEI